MTRLAVSKACEDFSATLSRVAQKGERIVLHRGGKAVAVLIPVEDLTLLEELEDRLDAEDFRAAKEEWEQEGRPSRGRSSRRIRVSEPSCGLPS